MLAIPPELLARVVEAAAPDKIIVYGSRARGDARADSDWDLLVVKANIASRRKLAQAIYAKLYGLALPVDVVVMTPDDLERFSECPWTIVPEVLREGKVVYGA